MCMQAIVADMADYSPLEPYWIEAGLPSAIDAISADAISANPSRVLCQTKHTYHDPCENDMQYYAVKVINGACTQIKMGCALRNGLQGLSLEE